MTSAHVTTQQLRIRLRNRFAKVSSAVPVPQYAVLFEVPFDGRERNTRTSRQRMDAVAVGMWASTGHAVHGFELKSSRADLRKELVDLSKSSAAVALVDYFWLVLASKDLLKDISEVPPLWGVLVVSGQGLRALRRPTRLPGGADARFVAGLVQTALREPSYRLRIGETRGFTRAENIYRAQVHDLHANRLVLQQDAAARRQVTLVSVSVLATVATDLHTLSTRSDVDPGMRTTCDHAYTNVLKTINSLRDTL